MHAERTDVTQRRALWINQTTVVWTEAALDSDHAYALLSARNGGLRIEQGALRHPPATSPLRLRLVPQERQLTVVPNDQKKVTAALKGQVIIVRHNASGVVDLASGVQIPGVLDDVYAAQASTQPLGVVFRKGHPSIAVWAPTAHRVVLELTGRTAAKPVLIRLKENRSTGVWSVCGDPSWNRCYYRFRVTVYQPALERTHTACVIDPYAISVSPDSQFGQIIDPTDPDLVPPGWPDVRNSAVPQHRVQVHELSVRDFSIGDPSVPEEYRGTYAAFTFPNTEGMSHLRRLAAAGLTHIQLLPVLDGSSVGGWPPNILKGIWKFLASFPPDSSQQQKLISALISNRYSWGYDPRLFMVVEGFYASDPAGIARIIEFRRMVESLANAGLGTVLDVVYNHTPGAGITAGSVLDQIVPGYYQRLLDDGSVATSTTGASTAPEHAMMGRLIVDATVTLAKMYKISGFRFDLMGHHPKANILAVRDALRALTLREDGIDGRTIVFWGEGWNFGDEVADNARFIQATQFNLAGTGIGTFNDRLRDAVRGGSPFDDNPRRQGFASGLYTDPNGDPINGLLVEQRAMLLHYQDIIQVGLTGNLARYSFTDSAGRRVTGARVDWGGSPAGYTASPEEAVTYVDAHDGEILYDALAYKLPQHTTMANRVRVQVLALAITALSQGIGFVTAGSDHLRSKSLDANSYTSGDWFNAMMPREEGNGFGRGLPPETDNGRRWTYARPLLADPTLVGDESAIRMAEERYTEFLRIRASSPLFHLGSAEQVQHRLSFPLSGSLAQPGVIVMVLDDTVGHRLDRTFRSVVVVFNATRLRKSIAIPGFESRDIVLHPILASSSDPAARTASFTSLPGAFDVPARTVAVFVELDGDGGTS